MNNYKNLKKNILKRILTPVVLFSLILLLIITILFFNFNQNAFVKQNLLFCIDLANLIEFNFIKDTAFNNFDSGLLDSGLLNKYRSKFDTLNTRITLIDINGKVIYDNKYDFEKMETHFDRKELLKSTKNIVSYDIRTSKTLGKKMFYFSKVIIKDGEPIGFIRVANDIEGIKSYNRYFIIFIIIFFISIFLIFYYFLSNYIFFLISIINLYSNNLKDIANKVINSGNVNLPIVKKKLIFGKKLQNRLESQISSEFEETKIKIKFNEVDILAHIFNNIEEPAILFSENGICLYANNLAKNIFIPEKYHEHYKEKYYWEIFLTKEINETIEKVIQNKNSSSIEIEINDRLYFLRIIYSNFINCILLMFSDISEISRYYELRKGILSAISHELKTPLTSINGFLEQIILEAENKKDEKILSFSQIAKRNCDRLFNISQDVIEIEKIHYQKEIDLQELDVILEIEQILTLFTNLASTKGISINFNKVYNSLIIKTNKSLFDQILINLIDNAIKYTEKGSVSIDITKLENEVKLIIADTGIGIEEKEIPKIFEPFYCVDKSRSKQKGGTGLGLAIVKSAIERLNAHIEVESILFEGTKFIVRFK